MANIERGKAHTINWNIRDQVNRLEVSRKAALVRRGIRWGGQKNRLDANSTEDGRSNSRMRKEDIVAEGSKSLIDEPKPFWKKVVKTTKDKI